MALSIRPIQPLKPLFFSSSPSTSSSSSFSLSIPTRRYTFPICLAATKSRSGPPVKKRSSSNSSSSSNKKTAKKKNNWSKKGGGNSNLKDVEIVKGFGGGDGGDDISNLRDVEIVKGFGGGNDGGSGSDGGNSSTRPLSFTPTMPLPKPPAGFLLDENGRVLLASTNRIVTIVDSANNSPLECVVRRVFRSSRGDECMLICPVDTPVQILKSINVDGWSAVPDEDVEDILPAAAYALAKIHMHLVHSGFCYTARGGFCYSEDDIFDFRTDDGKDVEGVPTEGIEITCFQSDGAHYMLYTPSDPYLFVAVKDQNGMLQIADDDLLEDPAIIDAIDEETEFNALVEEEAALLESLMMGEE